MCTKCSVCIHKMTFNNAFLIFCNHLKYVCIKTIIFTEIMQSHVMKFIFYSTVISRWWFSFMRHPVNCSFCLKILYATEMLMNTFFNYIFPLVYNFFVSVGVYTEFYPCLLLHLVRKRQFLTITVLHLVCSFEQC